MPRPTAATVSTPATASITAAETRGVPRARTRAGGGTAARTGAFRVGSCADAAADAAAAATGSGTFSVTAGDGIGARTVGAGGTDLNVASVAELRGPEPMTTVDPVGAVARAGVPRMTVAG